MLLSETHGTLRSSRLLLPEEMENGQSEFTTTVSTAKRCPVLKKNVKVGDISFAGTLYFLHMPS